MTLQLCLTDWDAQATKEKALKGQVTTGERNFSVYGAGSQALRTKVAAVLGCSGQGFISRLPLPAISQEDEGAGACSLYFSSTICD